MAQNSTVNSLISLGVTVGVAYVIYKWLSAQCAQGSGSLLMGSPVCSAFGGIFTASAPSTVPASVTTSSPPAAQATGGSAWIPPTWTSQPPVGNPPVVSPSQQTGGTATSVDPWANALTQLKAAAGTDSLNFDQWAYYWANPGRYSAAMPGGFGVALSGDIMTAIIAAGGGDRTKSISAETFIGLMQGAYSAAGLSGFPPWTGPAGPGISADILGVIVSPRAFSSDIGLPMNLIHGGSR